MIALLLVPDMGIFKLALVEFPLYRRQVRFVTNQYHLFAVHSFERGARYDGSFLLAVMAITALPMPFTDHSAYCLCL